MKTGFFKAIWLGAGLVCVGLAFIGVALPLIPTTPFLLLAAFCFARSSQKLHNWLYTHKIFGPLLNDWEAHGAIRPKVKCLAVCCLIGALALSYFMGVKPYVFAIQLVVILASGTFILTRPNGPKA